MAVPKKKSSKTRGRKRRTHWRVKKAGSSTCPSCGQPKLPHRVCPHCGTYNGREVIAEEKEKE